MAKANASIMAGMPTWARLTYFAHLAKACFKQHHSETRPIFEAVLPKNGTVIEAGAHAGQFTKLLASVVPNGHVYAIEPSSYAFRILWWVSSFKNLKNVTVRQLGFSDMPGELTLSMPVKASGSYGFGLSHFSVGKNADERPSVRELVPVTTVDEFVERNKIDHVDLLKADIEGWEMKFLQGALGTIRRDKPSVLLELVDTHLSRGGSSTQDVWDLLMGLGYRGYMFSPGLAECDEGKDDADIIFVHPASKIGLG